MKGRSSRGFTLVELLVSMLILGILSAGVVSVLSQSFRYSSDEQRFLRAVSEAKRSLMTLAHELRMSGKLSPYLIPLSEFANNCLDDLEVTNDSLRFFVAHDTDSNSGRQVYWVAYKWVPTEQTLYRGEVPLVNNHDCTRPGEDPLHSSKLFPIAYEVDQELDSNGVALPIFSIEDLTVSVHIKVAVPRRDGALRVQGMNTKLLIRS